MKPNSITAVFTSCGRPDLLFKTLNSFHRFNDHTISRIIVVEDGLTAPSFLQSYRFETPSSILSTGKQVGQIAAIDYAYSLVDTEYIFHVEDDWEFYKTGFISKSLRILKQEPRCLQVWLRALTDTNGHKIEKEIFYTKSIFNRKVPWRKLALGYQEVWNGFSFNPGLRRMSDYIRAGGYGKYLKVASSKADIHGFGELAMSMYYKNNNYFAAILADHSGQGYVRHLGENRSSMQRRHHVN
jgi:hypothetical protein